MNDTIILTYKLDQHLSWDETIKLEIPLADLSEYTQITKTLSAMISFFTKIGYSIDMIADSYSDITEQLEDKLEIEEPNYDSPEKEIDEHIKNIDKYFTAPDLTLAQFKKELKKEAFIQYLYQVYLDDNEERVVN